MGKETPEHYDKLGKPLAVGDYVVYVWHNSLAVGSVRKLNPKMVGVSRVNSRGAHHNKYSYDTVKVDTADVTMYLIKNSK